MRCRCAHQTLFIIGHDVRCSLLLCNPSTLFQGRPVFVCLSFSRLCLETKNEREREGEIAKDNSGCRPPSWEVMCVKHDNTVDFETALLFLRELEAHLWKKALFSLHIICHHDEKWAEWLKKFEGTERAIGMFSQIDEFQQSNLH